MLRVYFLLTVILFKTKDKLNIEIFIAKAKGTSIKDVLTNREKLTPLDCEVFAMAQPHFYP